MKRPSLLINTKFIAPRVDGHAVAREELLSRLHEARHCRLILITGGAGYGKTLLLAQWRQALLADGAKVAWLTLSPDDEQLETWGANLVGSLLQAGLSDDALSSLGEAEAELDAQSMASLLIGALDHAHGELYLVIDDFHYASDPRIERLMQSLIDAAPHHLHIVLSSRNTPDLLLGRWRARGEVHEIDGRELAFRFRESQAFLRANLDKDIDLDAAHLLHEKADGWPIGLQLLSMALKADPRRQSDLAALQLNRRGLGAYLTEDVLKDLPEDLLAFLRKVAILRRFNVAVAAHVTGSARAQDHIQALQSRNLFLQSVDAPDDSRWFRLHRMFAEFLAQRPPAEDVDVRELYRRASQWFEQAGLIAEAVRYALLTEDVDGIVALLKRVKPPQKSVSHLRQFVRWLEHLPLERLAHHPDLLLLGVWCCVLTLRAEPALTWLAAVEATPGARQWADQIALIKASLAIQHDDAPACLSWLDTLSGQPLDSPFLQEVQVCLQLGCLAHMGRYAEVRHAAEAGALRAMRDSTHEMALLAMMATAVSAQLEGRVLDAERIGGELLARAEHAHGRRSVSACSCGALMSSVLYELNRLDDAREVLANRLDVLRVAAPEFMIHAALTHARLQHAQASARLALDDLERKEEHFRQAGLSRGVANMLAEQVRIVLAGGDIRQAERLQARLEDLRSAEDEQGPRHAEIVALAALSMARILWVREQPERGLQVLSGIDGIIQEYGRGLWRVQADLLRCLLLDRLGRTLESQEYLRAAVARGYRHGLVRTFLDQGEALQVLLKGLPRLGERSMDDYVSSLIVDAITRGGTLIALGAQGEASLTKREWEILSLLEQSMSNKRIALALHISLETVKWNLKNIFVKLGVSNRYDAIVLIRKHLEQAGAG
ncbi:LuxR family transcriptional regulator, maltose regulon positive regulatory protein [Dyella jiangningensis]|uniref:LuxR C-terminal-related transcriptional regulator n=2 Tax=Gammaproteobacteria TaxID=1236 RepID=UPI00088B3CD6|nr:LuxR C-terminal-related transcriptional regulator [Dyella sp. AtDHG13]PXV56961.1 LuxR family maltose regulon positive regulatory protein [Dyella sp. AtDHG13]SDK62263.1 LuxR family transcriptional regulator, maltose regulon positive regulatory protein [Dyella jiangningensis]